MRKRRRFKTFQSGLMNKIRTEMPRARSTKYSAPHLTSFISTCREPRQLRKLKRFQTSHLLRLANPSYPIGSAIKQRSCQVKSPRISPHSCRGGLRGQVRKSLPCKKQASTHPRRGKIVWFIFLTSRINSIKREIQRS